LLKKVKNNRLEGSELPEPFMLGEMKHEIQGS